MVGSRGLFAPSSIVRSMALEFKAAGDEATAMQRAQESGCLPETVLALAALTDYRIVGSEADNGILRIEESWPAAWRMQATRSHRALAFGCRDDIDLILRIFSEWQGAQSPDGWCAMWWVNHAMMHQVESDVGAVFGSLAAAGPLGMRRPVDPNRAPQVREALADAFDDAFFERVGLAEYRPFGEDPSAGRPYRPSNGVLMEPGERIIALGRDREARLLEHIISVDQSGVADDPLAAVRHQWPVGSVVEISTLGSVTAGRMVTDILTLHRGFPFPEGATPTTLETPPSTPSILAAPAHGSAPIDVSSSLRVRIVGYRVNDQAEAVLVVDPIASDAPIDPADHPDLGTWDDIEVTVRGVTSDHFGALLELGRNDGYGSFFVPPGAGLSDADAGFGERLVEGARLTARVLPEPPAGDFFTVSLLPEAIRHLESMPGIDNRRPVPAKVIHNGSGLGTVTVELDHRDAATGISHRLDVERGRLMEGFASVVGAPVDVVLRPDRSRARRRLPADDQMRTFVANNSDVFAIANGWVELSPAPPDIASVVGLLTIDESDAWEREVVWFYEDNLHLEAALIGPAGDPQLSEIAATLPGFMVQHPSRSATEAVVEPVVVPIDAERPVESDRMADVVELAPRAASEPVVPAPAAHVWRMIARLPAGSVARVEGPGGAALRELRAGPQVLAVVTDDDIVTVVAESGRAARSVMSEIQRLILPAKGKLILPPGGAKRLIGIDGTTLRALQVKTGCEAHDPGDGELWIVEGPSHAAVKEFLRMAAEQVQGVIGRVTDMQEVELLAEERVPHSDVAGLLFAQNGRPTDASGSGPPIVDRGLVAESVAAESAGEQADGQVRKRAPIRPLKRSAPLEIEDVPDATSSRAERKEAKAEAKQRARAQRAERRAAKAERKNGAAEQRRADKAAAAAVVERADEVEASVEADDGRRTPITPRASKTPVGPSTTVKGVALILALAAVAAALWLVTSDFFGDEESAQATPTTVPSAAAEQPDAATASPMFAVLEDVSAIAPESCWLAVMATWDNTAQATEGVQRMQSVGLPATATPSDLVPNWAANRTVGVVPVETAPQAAEAVARAGDVGFRGVAIESSLAGCADLDIVPAGSSLGYVDVPYSDPDQAAIQWMANVSLMEPCNPPLDDQFCPEALVTRGELASVLAAALVEPPAAPDDPTAPATSGDLASALGTGDGDSATPLLRRDLAAAMLTAYQTGR